MNLELRSPTQADEGHWIAAVQSSRELHHLWVSPPADSAAFHRYLAACEEDNQFGTLLVVEGAIAGCITVSGIIRGRFMSGYLGFYAMAGHTGQGVMTRGLSQVIDASFTLHGLHRLEANIQPGNLASIGLVRKLGFEMEGFSPRYLFIDGDWRDHERWALTTEQWAGL